MAYLVNEFGYQIKQCALLSWISQLQELICSIYGSFSLRSNGRRSINQSINLRLLAAWQCRPEIHKS